MLFGEIFGSNQATGMDKEDGLTIQEWKAKALAAEDLVQRLRGIIQKLEEEKAALIAEGAQQF